MTRKVAIYARVSTEHEAQLSALDNQIQYYDNVLAQHPDWELFDRYIDEGITGTSVKKRKNFMRMLEDAEKGNFDLIITREVSRFARNTVDTLQETRKLKRMGIEVWFTEDNIWTMNDEDGELRLTIMATLAQNESKKTSVRVRAGQKVSFQNGVPYGNGNILGYDRVGDKFVINEEQAKTVRMIYDWYLEGWGLKKITVELEKAGRKTSMGCTQWFATTVTHVLSNPFYFGKIVYRKEIVTDYLEQKRVKNKGQAEKYYADGKHQPIVSEEEFMRVQKLLDDKRREINGKRTQGIRLPVKVWGRKLKCSCGHCFNRKIWHRRNDTRDTQFAYQCYGSIKTGTISYRAKRGLSNEGICASPMIQEWKLEMMADYILRPFLKDRDKVLDIAEDLLKHNLTEANEAEHNADEEERNEIKAKIEKLEKKIDNLLDLRLSDEISKEIFTSKKDALSKDIDKLKARLEELDASIALDFVGTTEEALQTLKNLGASEKIEKLKEALRHDLEIDKCHIPDTIVDVLVDKIIVYPDHFDWYLNLSDEEVISCGFMGTKKNPMIDILSHNPPNSDDGSGCYRRSTLVESTCFLGTFEVPKDFMEKSAKLYFGKDRKARFPEKLEFKLFLI